MPLDTQRILSRCEALARHSESREALTRVFLSPEQAAASAEVAGWMREAGMTARIDAIGNVVGRYEGHEPGAPCLLLGSHLDTVRDAGRYDGILGVAIAVDCVADLAARGVRLPFAIEVVGFADEEGVRFAATLLGSRALAGTFDANVLDNVDDDGVSMRAALVAAGLEPDRIADAARARGEVLAFVELHIEQGPVLERLGLPVGVVTAISGSYRFRVDVTGRAGHAGTVPMHLRRDALATAAECVLVVERVAQSRPHVVATVGTIEAAPGAINVIPGRAHFSLDVRAPTDVARQQAYAGIRVEFAAIAARRDCPITITPLWEAATTTCDDDLQRQLAAAIEAEGIVSHLLPSGAGHDGMAIVAIAPVAMLFLRCIGGISHNPAEAVRDDDVGTGARVLLRFIEQFQPPRR